MQAVASGPAGSCFDSVNLMFMSVKERVEVKRKKKVAYGFRNILFLQKEVSMWKENSKEYPPKD